MDLMGLGFWESLCDLLEKFLLLFYINVAIIIIMMMILMMMIIITIRHRISW